MLTLQWSPSYVAPLISGHPSYVATSALHQHFYVEIYLLYAATPLTRPAAAPWGSEMATLPLISGQEASLML